MNKINSMPDLISAVNEYGLLTFWDEQKLSAWRLSGVNFNALWELREQAVNSKQIVYGKFVNKKSTFCSLELFPYLCALRRDGYDFDSLCDEGLVSRRESDIYDRVTAAGGIAPSYSLGKSMGIKGFDGAVTALQHKTYLCVTFKKSAMGTALISPPEFVFGRDYVRSRYGVSTEECRAKLLAAKGLCDFSSDALDKILCKAV